MPTSTVEDYAKAIYVLQRDAPTGQASVARLAATLGVTKGTVTSMVRKLKDAEIATAERYGGISLTPTGTALAMDVIRRHRLIEVFLVETLGFDWAEVHEEAERLEHALSAKVLDRLDAFLGYPTTDPHGDPIPDAQGRVAEESLTPVSTFRSGERGRVVRIADQAPAFLEFVDEQGLRPGRAFSVVERVDAAGSITLKPARRESVVLSFDAAEKLLAERR